MSDPVSWFVVEHGWPVVGADGEELGAVEEVIGDAESDIFSGLSISSGLLGRRRYVPAERVREIVEGRVELDLGRDAFQRLADREAQPGEPPSP
jgi:uncharacterized protein YrrD